MKIIQQWVLLKCGDENEANLKCIICGDNFLDERMVSSRLQRNFSTTHNNLNNKSIEYFRSCLKSKKKNIKLFKVLDKVQESNYIISELIAKK